jgi:hypothetical protein
MCSSNPRSRAAANNRSRAPLVGGDAAADLSTGGSFGRCCERLRHQRIDDGLLKAGRQIGDLLLRKPGSREIGPAWSGDCIAHGGLQTAEAEVEPLAVAGESAREIIGPRVSALRRAAMAGPPGYGRPGIAATLSNASPAASSIVPPGTRTRSASISTGWCARR